MRITLLDPLYPIMSKFSIEISKQIIDDEYKDNIMIYRKTPSGHFHFITEIQY